MEYVWLSREGIEQNVMERLVGQHFEAADFLPAPVFARRARALTEDGHAGRIYDITGPEALSHGEMAEELSGALNRQIRFVDVPPEAMRETLLGVGFPVWQADGLIEDYAHYSRGEASEVATGVQDATGKLPRSFDDFVRDYAHAFSPSASQN